VPAAAELRRGGPSRDWCEESYSAPQDLDASSARLAAEYWRAAALMEHASIAAFARFSLQLLELGAPLELTLACQAALRDETEHARRCFTLAARYAGAALGPGALSMAGALEVQSLPEIASLAFREGCVGETCAALEASAALETATDRAVVETLELIARDERRHAELARRFLAWALQQDSTGEVREVVQGELERAHREMTARRAEASRAVVDAEVMLSHHGILSAASRNEVRQAALALVVVPCAERLLESSTISTAPASSAGLASG
jgi:hypothetical protein